MLHYCYMVESHVAGMFELILANINMQIITSVYYNTVKIPSQRIK